MAEDKETKSVPRAVEIIDPNIYFKLAEGSSHERSIPMLTGITLGKEYDLVFGLLRELYEAAQGIPAGVPQRGMIRGIWILWCYAAHDISELRNQIDLHRQQAITDSDTLLKGLTDEIDKLRAEVATLRGTVEARSQIDGGT